MPFSCLLLTSWFRLWFYFNRIDTCGGCFRFNYRNETGKQTTAGL